MSRRATWYPRARRDVVDQALYLDDEADAATAERFLGALERTLRSLLDFPDMGSPRLFQHPKLKGVRVMPIRGFERHLIFYRPTRAGIVIVRVLHASRDLGAVFGP